MEDLKKEALAEFLNTSVEDIEERGDYYFDYNSNDSYLVLTEQEANDLVAEKSREMLWTFYPSYLIPFMSSKLKDAENIEKIIEFLQGSFCDSCNEVLYLLIEKKYDDFVESVIEEGRENIIDSYDGKENEVHYKNNWLYIYRMD